MTGILVVVVAGAAVPAPPSVAIAVAGLAATNFAARLPMRIVPGLDRVAETVGRYTIERFAKQTMGLHRGDRKYSRHDALGTAPARGPARVIVGG